VTRDLARTPLFQITDIENLEAIVVSNGLRSDVDLAGGGGPAVNIGYRSGVVGRCLSCSQRVK